MRGNPLMLFTQMPPMSLTVTFNNRLDLEFRKKLKERVSDYFKSSGLSIHQTPAMLVKTGVMLSLYVIPYALILSNLFPPWAGILLYLLMGVGISGIGMCVMHDANHSSYSRNQGLNRLLGLSLNLMGGDAYNWKIKHNKLHHVFTNIYGKDEDIQSRAILRFAYSSPLKPYHRYQYLYAWFFYSLMTLSIVFGDIPKRIRYRKEGLTNLERSRFVRSLTWLIVGKLIYFVALIVLPIVLTSLTWWQVLLGFLLMHLTAGTILSLIFQMAHVVEGPGQISPNDQGMVDHSMIRHQLSTTADFSKNNKWLSWFVGGLNFQVEHHLFPRICHVHYPALAKIVETTTREFGMPYYVYSNFRKAFASHWRVLRELGSVKTPSYKQTGG